jgi:hypothetical protein
VSINIELVAYDEYIEDSDLLVELAAHNHVLSEGTTSVQIETFMGIKAEISIAVKFL